MSLLKKPIFWIATAVLGYAGYTMTEAPPESGSGIKVTARKPSKPKKTTAIEFTEEDFNAEFDPVNIVVKDSFHPLVVRNGSRLNRSSIAANVIPSTFAGGETGWVYTGNAELEGVATALLENRVTNEGVFVKRGEKWKGAIVTAIYSDSIVLRGEEGETMTFSLVNEQSTASPVASANLSPMRMNVPGNMSGPIGSQGFGMTPQMGDGSGSFTQFPQGNFSPLPAVIPDGGGQ